MELLKAKSRQNYFEKEKNEGILVLELTWCYGNLKSVILLQELANWLMGESREYWKIYIYTHTHTNIYIYLYIFQAAICWLFIYMCVYIYIYEHMCVCVCVNKLGMWQSYIVLGELNIHIKNTPLIHHM